jgi:hypothetical protein
MARKPTTEMLASLRLVGEGRVTKIFRGPANIIEFDGERVLSLELRKAERNGWIKNGPHTSDDINRRMVVLTPTGEKLLDKTPA